jgi:hypothetical protein
MQELASTNMTTKQDTTTEDAAVAKTKPTTEAIATTIANVRKWGVEKGITGPEGKATVSSQLLKSQEELSEARRGASKLNVLTSQRSSADPKAIEDAKLEVVDGIGDLTVTLILAADLLGVSFEDCLAHAYNIIKDRKGKMIGGQFVKE